jgi:hypothetical protein
VTPLRLCMRRAHTPGIMIVPPLAAVAEPGLAPVRFGQGADFLAPILPNCRWKWLFGLSRWPGRNSFEASFEPQKATFPKQV